MPVQIVGAIECGEDLLADAATLASRFLRLPGEVLEHDHELVAAEAGNRIAFTNAGRQSLADLFQQTVAHVVSEGIVERLEIVEIDEQQGPLSVSARARHQRQAQTVVQQAAVGQAGERVVKGQMADLFLRLLAHGDVGQRRHVVGDFFVAVPDRGNGQPFGVGLAVLAPVPDLTLPGSRALECVAHRRIEGGVVAARTEQLGRPTDTVGRGVARDLGERLVHPQNYAVGVGNEHSLLRLEGRRSDAFPLLGLLLVGHVVRDDNHTHHLAALVVDHLAGRRHVPDAAVVSHQAVLQFLTDAGFRGLPERVDHPLTVIRMHVGE
ncbi:MAG: hypothetical protein AW10_03851 [Candidatus Accumulibacter appositus]|uniref:Uncharacterized protein n=1 Tax=Candidatus Accumulibacter appositus TaxID=1454003 RepID=A0A011NPV9_9PROT|nr:MAG: hypothetical protein AW10_03851 [Candidatus Accumulibacter appositus]